MVKVREHAPITPEGELDIVEWLSTMADAGGGIDSAGLRDLCELIGGFGTSRLLAGAEMAQLVLGAGMDETSVRACLLYRLLRDDLIKAVPTEQYDQKAIDLAQSVLRIGQISLLELNNSRLLTSEAKDQVDNIRRMLVSMIDDPRAAIVKLAERIVALRRAKNDEADRQIRIGREALWIFAPLANRLGIWRFKWELEDLALRYLEPASYKLIASNLDGRREEREQEVALSAERVAASLAERGIEAEVAGRAKHIYSIWQKMRNKGISFDDVYDVRAIRILVDDVAACYAALGVIHSEFHHVANEFDDYIANPKDNGYRSIHTAVVGPNGKTLEVQIRTFEMHRESELGVCAHWDYKEGVVEHSAYQDKMDWFRQMLDLEDDLGDMTVFLRDEVLDERIYVHTPNGHVLDLNMGATALDFAYRVHTHVGHCAIGCRINGLEQPLNRPLETGQTVDIVTGDNEQPLRDWLERSLSYVNTARARSKIHAWFRGLDREQLIVIGRDLLFAGAERLAVALPDDLPRRLECADWPSFFEVLGRGDLQFMDVARKLDFEAPQLSLLDVPGDEVNRVIRVTGIDREGLLHDLTTVLGDLGLSLVSISGSQADSRAEITLTTRIDSLFSAASLIDSIRKVAGVIEVRRTL